MTLKYGILSQSTAVFPQSVENVVNTRSCMKKKYRHIPWNRYNLEKYRDINFWSYRPALVVDKPFIHTDTNPYCNSLYFTALHDITRYTEYFIFRTGFCDSVHKVCVLVSCHFPSIWGAWDLSTKPSQFPPTTCPSLTIAPCSQHSQTCILMQSLSSDWGVIHSER